MIRLFRLELLLIFALAGFASARQEALTFEAGGEPLVQLLEGPAELVEVVAKREELTDWPGFRLRVRVTNSSPAPVTLSRIDLLDHELGNPSVIPQTLRVLTFDQRDDGLCRVFALLNRLESRRFLAAALPGGEAAVLAGFVKDEGGLTGFSIEPHEERIALSAWLEWDDLVLLPGGTFTSPELIVFFSPDGLIGLDWLFEQMAAANGLKLPSPGEPVGASSSMAASQPIGVNDPSLDGPPGDRVPHFRFAGDPLDLFAGDGLPSAWRLAGREGELLLVNHSHERRLSGASFRDLRLEKDGVYRITATPGPDGAHGPDGPDDSANTRELGLYRRGVVIPLAPRTSLRVRAEPVEPPPDGVEDDALGFELLLIRVPDPELPATLQPVETNHPDLYRELAETLNEGGVVIANHRGTDRLELLPPALEPILKARIIPYRPERLRPPRLEEEELFSARSSNLEWALDFPSQDLEAEAWLICPEAGLSATPLQAAVADGHFAGRGFALRCSRGLVLITMNLSPEQRDALAGQLLNEDRRLEAMRQAGLARVAVNKIPEPSGLFKEFGLERYRPFDLAPAHPAAMRRWSVLIPGGPRQIRHLLIRPGQMLREEVLNLGGRMTFGIDTALGEREQMVIVVRRAPEPSPVSYVVEIDNLPLGPPVVPKDEDPRFWQEDVWLLGNELIQHRGRVALGLAPSGGTLALARVGFFRHEPKPGVHLDTLDPVELDHDGMPPGINRSASGRVLRIGEEAFLKGLGLAGNTSLTYALDGRYEMFLARAGIDAELGVLGSAALAIRVDGEERFRSEPLQGGQAPVPVAVIVRGAQQVVLQSISSEPDTLLDLAEARLSR